MGAKLTNLPGSVFGRLTVLAEGPKYVKPSGRPERTMVCSCVCGKTKTILLSHLRAGKILSCGCFRVETTKRVCTTHGGTAGIRPTPLYRTWTGMLSRCRNPNYKGYKNYGGRGIYVAAEWVNNFAAFQTWVVNTLGPRPPGCSLDRVGNDAGYAPGNLRWATAKDQANNRKTCINLELGGVIKTATQWAEVFGVSPGSLHTALKKGLTLEQALIKLQEKANAQQ